jgi:hypothetical protein
MLQARRLWVQEEIEFYQFACLFRARQPLGFIHPLTEMSTEAECECAIKVTILVSVDQKGYFVRRGV